MSPKTNQKARQKALVAIVWRADPAAVERQVLMLKLIPKRGGFWQPVTGSVEKGETFAEAALREAQEESGLSFDRSPQFLGLEYSFEDKWGTSTKQAFLLPVIGGAAPPAVTIDPTEHVAYEWMSPANAIAAVKFDTNRKALERATQVIPPLFLSKAGSFWQDGEEITHGRTAELLHASLVKAGDGFLARIGAEEIDVVVEDTPRFVKSYDRSTGTLTLSDGQKELMRETTFSVRADDSLACQLGNGWWARFLSGPHYEIARDISEGSIQGEYVLHFLGRRHLFRITA